MPPAYGSPPEARHILASKATTGSDTFQSFVVYPTGSWPEAVGSGEYTNDDRTDVALSTSFDWDPANDYQVHLLAQTITGTLTRVQQVAAGDYPVALARGDLNRDGHHDLTTANQKDDTLGVFVQTGGGSLTPMVAYTAGAKPDGVAVGDFNGDLRDDVAVSHAVSQTVAIYHQQSDGTLGAPVHLGVSSAGYNDIAAGDLNGDGYDDLVLLRGAGHASSQVAVFYQQDRALGAPVLRTAEDGGFLTHGLAVGDVTGDGRDDVVVTAGGNSPQAYINVFVQQPDGSLATSPIVYAAFHLPESVEVGDVNHDGRNDVVAVHAAWLSLSVYTQTVTGALSPYERYPLPYNDHYQPGGLALADVTGDGALDTLIASHSSLPAENGLVVLTNSGDAPTSTITVPTAGVYITDTVTYQIQGTASTTSGTLEISTDGGRTWHAQSAATNWTTDWTVPADGSYILLARVTDAAGRVQSPPARSRAIVDRTLPTGSLLVDGGATYTTIPTVTLTVNGSDFNGLDTMRLVNQGNGYSAWITFAPTHTWVLAGADGTKTVTGQVRDVPGNVSLPFSDTIILDTTPPSCGILVNDSATYVSSTQVTLTLSATDANGVAQMRVRNAGDSWPAWQPYATSLAWNLGGGDGTHTIEVQFRDVAGNESAVCSDDITLDTTPPSCGIVIAGGADYTTQPTVTLYLSSSDANGVAQMRFSNDSLTWSSWVDYSTIHSWDLATPDGVKTVWVQFEDVAGNSSTCQDAIILDTTPPTGFVIVDGGALYTGIPTVTLTLGASDTYGVAQMRFSNDGATWDSWQAYVANAAWVLSSGDGAKTVYVQYQGTAGNVGGPFTDEITLDTTPPGGSIVVDGGATYTRIPTVTLAITATDEIPVTQMRLSHDGMDWTTWEAYASSRTWVLLGGDGTKTVYVQFRDAVGNTSAALADAIVLDTTPPTGQLFIDGGAVYATQTAVTLNAAGSDANPPLQVRYSNDGSTWSGWESYVAVRSWTLDAGDGVKTVYLEVMDAPGNVGGPFTDTIILDTTAPDCTLRINGDASFTNLPGVTLDINCVDPNGLDAIRLSSDGVNWDGWRAYATALPWTLLAGDGEKVVYLQALDVPGNVSAPVSDAIVLDTTAPSGGCSVVDDNGYVNNTTVTLSLWSYDENGVADMQVRDSGSAWGSWVPFATSHPWTLPGGDGEKVVECRFRDVPGNVSSVYSTSVVLDTISPTCQVEINGGVDYVNAVLVTLVLSSTDSSAVISMCLSNDALNWICEPYATSRSWELSPGDGTKVVWLQFWDLAGNVQQCSTDVILDTTPPTCGIVVAGGAEYITQPTVMLDLNSNDVNSVAQMQFSDDGLAWSAWVPYTASYSWTLPALDGPHVVYVQFKDVAENQSTACQDDIVLDTTPPIGSVLVNDGALYTSIPTVMLSLEASDTYSVTRMQFSNDGITWDDWQTYATSATWVLSGNDGTKTVYVWYEDTAGNVGGPFTDDIILNTTSPDGAILIDGDATYTRIPTVTLAITATGEIPVTEMRLSHDGTSWTTWEAYATSRTWVLTDADGTKTVYVQLQDAVSNTSEALTDTIILDSMPPAGGMIINGDALYTTQVSVTLGLSASDATSGVCEVQVRNVGMAWSEWMAFTDAVTWTVEPGMGERTVEVRFRDCAGNESAASTDSIQLLSPALYMPLVLRFN